MKGLVILLLFAGTVAAQSSANECTGLLNCCLGSPFLCGEALGSQQELCCDPVPGKDTRTEVCCAIDGTSSLLTPFICCGAGFKCDEDPAFAGNNTCVSDGTAPTAAAPTAAAPTAAAPTAAAMPTSAIPMFCRGTGEPAIHNINDGSLCPCPCPRGMHCEAMPTDHKQTYCCFDVFQTCGYHTSCDSCTGTPGCGWTDVGCVEATASCDADENCFLVGGTCPKQAEGTCWERCGGIGWGVQANPYGQQLGSWANECSCTPGTVAAPVMAGQKCGDYSLYCEW